jgi:hypothetical protein
MGRYGGGVPAGEREVYVRIIPSQITGRRIEIR